MDMFGVNDPWSSLGIDPTDDISAIRKAYAAKLRSTRPDEDPVAFQFLVEARDSALRNGLNGLRPELSADFGDDTNQKRLDSHEYTSRVSVTEDEPKAALNEFLLTLESVPRPGESLNVGESWARVFHVLDQVPLIHGWQMVSLMLNRLGQDMWAHFGALPDVTQRPTETPVWGGNFLAPYGSVLRELENRHHFLERDSDLLSYLAPESTRYILTALTIAVGRPLREEARGPKPHYEVPLIDEIYIDLAFALDEKMKAYCRLASALDKFPQGFSLFGLLLPLPAAFYYRLHGLAAFVTVFIVGYAGGIWLWKSGSIGEWYLFAIMGYVVFVLPIACMQLQGVRLSTAERKIRSLSRKHDLATIKSELARWGRPDRLSMWISFGFLLLVVAISFYS